MKLISPGAGRLATPAFLLIVVGLLLLRAAALVNPLILPDEYGYYALSQVHPRPEVYYAHDPYMLRLNNVAFFALGHLLFDFSDSPEVLLKVVNVLCFMAAVLLVRTLMACVADRPGWGGLWAAAALYPYSCFTVNFMPEIPYMLVFWAMACIIVLQAPRHPILGSVAAGVSGAVLFLLKPHAIAVIPALVLSTSLAAALAAAHGRWRRGATAGLVAAASFYLGMVLLFDMLGGPLEWSPLALVSGVYRPFLVRVVSRDARVLQLGAQVIAGNLLPLMALFGPALVALLWRGGLLARLAWRGQPMGDREIRMLVTLVFAVTAMAGLLAMTTKFTVDTTSAVHPPRVHGRYYGFAVPLLLVACAIGARDLGNMQVRGLRAMGLTGLAAAAGVWLVSRSLWLYPWDDPTIFAFSNWEGRALVPGVALAVVGAFYLSMLVPYRRWLALYPVCLAAVFLLGQLATFGWQRQWSGVVAERVAVGKAVRAMVSPEELDRGLIVGANRLHAFSAVLFGLRAPARVLELPRRATLDATLVPREVAWVAAVGKYDVHLPTWDLVRGPGFLFGRPRGSPAPAGGPSSLPAR